MKKKKKKTHKKRSDFWLPEAESGGGKLKEDGPKVQTSNYKLNEYEGCNVMTTIANTDMIYRKVVESKSQEFSSQRNFFYLLFFLLYLHKKIDFS